MLSFPFCWGLKGLFIMHIWVRRWKGIGERRRKGKKTWVRPWNDSRPHGMCFTHELRVGLGIIRCNSRWIWPIEVFPGCGVSISCVGRFVLKKNGIAACQKRNSRSRKSLFRSILKWVRTASRLRTDKQLQINWQRLLEIHWGRNKKEEKSKPAWSLSCCGVWSDAPYFFNF